MWHDHVVVCPMLVGRARHVQALGQLVDAARSARGQVALLSGEQAQANVTFVSDVQTSLDEGVVQFWRLLTGGGR
jgi:hypothetical protein